MNYEDIITKYIDHYHYAEGGPFSRSLFYFCCGFSRTSFIKMGGIEELMGLGLGYDDTLWREHWCNMFGGYEREIEAQCIHLWHPAKSYPRSLLELNRRSFELLKNYEANTACFVNKSNLSENQSSEDTGTFDNIGNHDDIEIVKTTRDWGNPDMLSAIYTIQDSEVVSVDKITENARELNIEI